MLSILGFESLASVNAASYDTLVWQAKTITEQHAVNRLWLALNCGDVLFEGSETLLLKYVISGVDLRTVTSVISCSICLFLANTTPSRLPQFTFLAVCIIDPKIPFRKRIDCSLRYGGSILRTRCFHVPLCPTVSKGLNTLLIMSLVMVKNLE
jgi:hypothetical protein